MNRLWNILSYIFHPLFMPVYGAFIIMWNDPLLYVERDEPVAWLVMLGAVFVCTALLPLLFSFTLLKMGRISSLKNANDADRRTLMIFTELGFLLAYLTFHNVPAMGHSILVFLFGINVVTVLTLLINLGQKTSFHTTGAGGLLGTVTGLMYYTRMDLKYWVVATTLLCIIVGYGRYKLKAHNTFELYLGYITGVVSFFLVFFFGTRPV